MDVLRLELKAGGVSAAHEDNVITRLRREGKDTLKFIDFLVSVFIHDYLFASISFQGIFLDAYSKNLDCVWDRSAHCRCIFRSSS